ncbi:hypothetical protein Tco_0874279 [Tanacetum coccineum]|uniref:Uncharacterized protein n=1 Tax=Tanacetum coccineum TaxID=301880 RepID=A0ABQ5BPV4_9ASTR
MIINYTFMAALVSCPKHNMVACLEKTEWNAQFHEIVDFLTRSSIYYSLTVSPTVSTSLIEQFWNTTTSKTVNDGDLTILTFQKALFSPQWKYLIHTLIHCLSSKSTSWDQFPTNIASALICLATDRKFNFSKMIFEGLIRNLDAKKQFLMYPRFVQVFLNNQLSNLPTPLDNLPIPVLTKKVFTNIAKQGLHFSSHVTPLFPNMLAQAVLDEGEVPRDSLEGIDGSKGDQVQSSNDRPHSGGNTFERAEGELNLQGRKNTKSKPTLDAFDDLDANLAHGIYYMETEEAVNKGRQSNETEELNLDVDTEVIAEDKGSGEKGGSTVSTARPEVDTARPDVDAARQEVSAVEPRTPPTTTSIFDDEDITMAQTLIKMKEEKAKEKGVAFKDVEDSSRPVRSITTLKPLPSIDPKDKGKGILVEEEPVKIKRKDQGIDQIERDEELAHKLHEEELAEIARIQEEKAAQEEASRVAIMEMFDEVQAGIDADALFAAKLQQEEREEYTIEERAKFLAETIAAQRKFRAAQRAAEIRSRPPTKSQLRNLMMTYLKNMGGYKHSQLKAKTFEEIQAMYERQKKKIDDFKPMDSDDAVKDSKKAAGEDTSKKEEVLKEPDSTKIESMNKEDAGERVSDVSKKRKGGPRMKRMSKRKKTESDLEEEEDLKTFLKIVPDKEGIIDYEVLEKRFPIINWESKFYHYDRHGAEGIYYRIFRSDGSSRWIKTFSEMVTRFDRLDLVELYNLVMQRFETITPEGVDLVLWGDLRTMFDANAEDELWQNQERWNLKSWNFYENCGVHTLTLEDGTEIHMLAERKYPLTKETLERMMSLKLIAESASDSAYDLLRFIQKQIDEAGSHDGGEKDL